MCSCGKLASTLVEVMSTVIGSEEDEDSQLVGLQMLQDALSKASPAILDHCARLGLVSKVAQLAGPPQSLPQEEEQQEKGREVSWLL